MRQAKSVLKRLAGYFVAGVLAVMPVVITVVVVAWVADYLSRFVGPQSWVGGRLKSFGLQIVDNSALAYLMGWVLVLGVLFALGLLVEFGAKKLIQGIVDALLNRVPVVSSIYGTSKQLISMLDKKDEADLQGMRSVFCMFGNDNPTAVLALLTSPERFEIGGESYHAVIIPTAPVPVGGGLLFVPVDKVMPADVSVDGLMSVYVSMGVTAPKFLPMVNKDA